MHIHFLTQPLPVMLQRAPVLRRAVTSCCQQPSARIGLLVYKCNIHLKDFFLFGMQVSKVPGIVVLFQCGQGSHINHGIKMHKYACDAKLAVSLSVSLCQCFLIFGPYKKNAIPAKIAALTHSEITSKHFLKCCFIINCIQIRILYLCLLVLAARKGLKVLRHWLLLGFFLFSLEEGM